MTADTLSLPDRPRSSASTTALFLRGALGALLALPLLALLSWITLGFGAIPVALLSGRIVGRFQRTALPAGFPRRERYVAAVGFGWALCVVTFIAVFFAGLGAANDAALLGVALAAGGLASGVYQGRRLFAGPLRPGWVLLVAAAHFFTGAVLAAASTFAPGMLPLALLAAAAVYGLLSASAIATVVEPA
jgi:hypothetical protein